MGKHKLHLHSMIVHIVAALAPLAAIAYLFYLFRVSFLSIGQTTWSFLVVFSLVMIFLVSIPSILTGVFERGHVYAKWHSTHKIKLALSFLLILFVVLELVVVFQSGLEGTLVSLFGVLTVFGNNTVVALLGVYGLKITLGRQSFGKASYTPDLFKEDPVDILVVAGEQRKKEAKYLDLLTER